MCTSVKVIVGELLATVILQHAGFRTEPSEPPPEGSSILEVWPALSQSIFPKWTTDLKSITHVYKNNSE